MSGLQQLFSPFGLAARALSSQSDASKSSDKSAKPDSLELTEETFSSLTDKIPQKPVGVVEGTSYTVLILAAFGVMAFFLYNLIASFAFEPPATQCFNHTLDKLRLDPRITVRLGEDIRGYGAESSNRMARQQIPHAVYKDATGTEHVRLQFHMRGPSGTALVSADMYQDASKSWQYTYLVVDIATSTSPTPQRLNIIAPGSPAYAAR